MPIETNNLVLYKSERLTDTSDGGFQHHQEKGGLDVMSLGYNELIAVLIKAVQELDTKLKALT